MNLDESKIFKNPSIFVWGLRSEATKKPPCPIGFIQINPPPKKKTQLVGGFNPFEKYESKWVHLPQFSGWKFQQIFELPPPKTQVGWWGTLWYLWSKRCNSNFLACFCSCMAVMAARQHTTPPLEIWPYQGLINHWFSLIRPAIKPLFLGGVGCVRGV